MELPLKIAKVTLTSPKAIFIMRLKIKPKLFFSFTFSIITVILLMTALIKWNVERSFLHYVNTVEIQHLNTISYQLAQSYSSQNKWKAIQANHSVWQKLIEPISQQPISPSEDNTPAHSEQRISLFDIENNLIIGQHNSTDNFKKQLILKKGVTIGYLTLQPLTGMTKPDDLSFIHQQEQRLYFTALGGILILASIALLLIHNMTTPIKRLLIGASALTSGEFQQRIEVKGYDELALLADKFNILAETLEKNRLHQRQWIADISHELRTPLSILHGEIQAIEDGVRKFDSHSLQSLASEVERLNKLIEDLYQLSLSDTGTLNYEKKPLDIVGLLRERLNAFSERIQERRLHINSHLPKAIIFNGDRQRLQQLLTNLLENSLRYTHPKGQLWLHCELDEKEIIIHLEDSKPSVPDEAMEQIFERLYRVEYSRSRSHGGGGLGLAICTSIVKAHNGTIHAKHSSLGGLCLEIKFPFNQDLQVL